MRHPLLAALAAVLIAACSTTPPPATPITATPPSSASPVTLADPVGEEWRAGLDLLVQRCERLAAGGDVDSAAAVLAELGKREHAQDEGRLARATMAVAQGLATAGRSDEALKRLDTLAWADKGPAVAARIVGLGLEIRWKTLLRDGRLVGGALPPALCEDSDRGLMGGAWGQRRDAYAGFCDLLDRGGRMVKAEGGVVPLPAPLPFVDLAAYAFGRCDLVGLGQRLGPATSWTPALARAAGDLHLDEFEIPAALACTETLWAQPGHGGTDGEALFRRLILWRSLRERARDVLALWPMPAEEARLATVAAWYPEAAAAVAAGLKDVHDLNGLALAAGAVRALRGDEVEEKTVQPVTNRIGGGLSGGFRFTTSWDGLALAPPAITCTAGAPVVMRVTSVHRGEHRLRLWRIAGQIGRASCRERV